MIYFHYFIQLGGRFCEAWSTFTLNSILRMDGDISKLNTLNIFKCQNICYESLK